MRLLLGDALAVTRDLESGSVQCIVTSPPYWGLRDYQVEGQIGLESTPAEYIARLVDVFREIRRALKDDGTLWLNLGDCYATGAGKVGDCPGGGQQGARWAGDASRLRDSRRRDRAPVVPSRALRDGTHAGKHTAISALGPMAQPNRMPLPGLKPKDLIGIPWRVAFALQAAGWWLRSDIVWSKPNSMPESVRDRPTKSHEYLFLLSKSEHYYYDAAAISEPVVYGDHPRNGTPGPPIQSPGQPAQTGFTKRRRSGNKERVLGPGRARPGSHLGASIPWEDLNGRRNRRSVWTICTQPYTEAHFATFPPALVEPCILAGSRVGDTVLDPFCGSGTTLLVAQRLAREGIGIDINPEYLAMTDRRLKSETPGLALEMGK